VGPIDQEIQEDAALHNWRIKIFYVVLGLIVIGIAKESIWTKPRFKLHAEAKAS